jgi:large subunit ribosomal protein L25
MAGIVLSVEKRERVGSGGARATRNAEMIPGVLYGGARGAVPIETPRKELVKALHSGKFVSHLIEIDVKGERQPVIPRAIQYHPVTDQPLHIDLFRVEENTTISVDVPVHFKNHEASPGLKRGGVLNIVAHTVAVTCLAAKIPEEFVVDLTGRELGHAIHLSDIALPEGVRAKGAARDVTIATIGGRLAEEAAPVAVAAEAEAAPAAGTKPGEKAAPAADAKKDAGKK